MAIDTVAKRFSILNLSSGDLLPKTDGTLAQADRQHMLDLYSGISTSTPSEGSSVQPRRINLGLSLGL